MSRETHGRYSPLRSRTGCGRGWKTVTCTWYGGEPLLAADVVADLSVRLRQVIDEAGGTLMPMGIITNGTLLDAAMVKRLTDVGITFAQISFDALVDEGRESRGVIDPDGKSSVILRNVIHAARHLNLNLRVNVHRANADDVPRILDVLREHKLEQFVNLARTSDLDGEAGCVTGPDGQRSKPAAKTVPLHVAGKAKPPARVKANPTVMTRPEYARFEQSTFPLRSKSRRLARLAAHAKDTLLRRHQGHIVCDRPKRQHQPLLGQRGRRE